MGEPEAPKAPERRRSSLKVIPPQFTEVFQDETYLAKKNMTLTAKVTGKPEPEIKWFRDDKPIASSFKIKMTKSEEKVTLQQSNITVKQSGVYKVVAISKAGTAEHSATIKVVEKLEPEKPKEESTPKVPKQAEPKKQQEEPQKQPELEKKVQQPEETKKNSSTPKEPEKKET